MSKLDLFPLNFKKWIDENRHLLKPPVGNRQVWENREFMVTVVGGPNSRTDYHINQGEEFFYQLEGDIVLKIMDSGKSRDISIREGDIFLLPSGIPHSPQRPENTIGLVLERKRLPHENDGFVWFCKNCGEKLYEDSIYLTNIVTQLPEVFKKYYGTTENQLCRHCGTQNE